MHEQKTEARLRAVSSSEDQGLTFIYDRDAYCFVGGATAVSSGSRGRVAATRREPGEELAG